MKPADFEQRLQRQPLRQVPAEWREEILTAAESAATRRPPPVTRPSWLSALNSQLSTILWPHPKAWAGLAAIWIVILAVDFSARDKTPVVAEKSSPPSPEVIVELRQQQRMLAELIGPRDIRDADRSKSFVPQPRSERAQIVTV
ncbi:MAG: hypothetical protein ABSC89_01100 [Verrucomicrobiota bacterium]|jgi:hypothetical protein